MTTSSPSSPGRPHPTIHHDAEGTTKRYPAGDDPARVGTLRGASVQFDARRLVKVVIGLAMVTLAALVAIFTVAGIHSNNQIDELHARGVPVTVTVTGCLGLLGGSGTNAAGYTCRGSFSLGGHHYVESLPGITFYSPETKIAAIAVPGDPTLLAKASTVSLQHSSAGVFVLPLVLGVALLTLVAAVFIHRRASGVQAAGAPLSPAPDD